MISFTKQLFDAKQALPLDDNRRQKLQTAHLRLTLALTALHGNPSRDNMKALNGAWITAERTLVECASTDPTPPRAGAGELEQKAA